jgi:hypothetical protein
VAQDNLYLRKSPGSKLETCQNLKLFSEQSFICPSIFIALGSPVLSSFQYAINTEYQVLSNLRYIVCNIILSPPKEGNA